MPTSERYVFLACEAGAAAWMAPVWSAIAGPCTAVLSDVARAHVVRRGYALPESVRGLEGPIDLDGALALCASATGRAAEAEWVAAARRAAIPSVQVIDDWGNYGRRFGEPAADRIAVIDRAAVDEATAAGIDPKRLVAVGHPAWETVLNLPPASRSHVLFVGQPVARYYGRTLGYDEGSAIAELQAAMRASPGTIESIEYLLHPEEAAPPVDIRASRDPAAIDRCGTVVGMFSTLMVEAHLAGRHVVSLQPRATGDDRCPLSRHGRIPRARDRAELVGLLARGFEGKPASALSERMAGSARRAAELLAGTSCESSD